MLIVTAAPIVAAPLELLALGFGGLAVVLAVGSVLAALGTRRALDALAEPAAEPADR